MDFPKPGDELRLEVENLALGGDGVARHEGLVCFVRSGVPGDSVRAAVRKRRRKHVECEIIELIAPSPIRTAPRCPHFGECGGCVLQHVNYEAQLRFKETHVRDCLERIGGLRDVPLKPIIGMEEPWFYRNKMEYTFGRSDAGTALGLMRRGRFDSVVDVRECYLQSPAANRILEAVRALARRWGLPPFDQRTHEGFLKNLVVRIGNNGLDYMVCVVTAPGDFPQLAEIKEVIARDFPEVKSLYRYSNPRISGAAFAGEAELVAGRPYIEETIHGLRFRVSPESFLQVNVRQTEALYSQILDLAAPDGNGRVLDLYCGAGPIALLLARAVADVVGIEVVEKAVLDARANAEANGIRNARFIAGAAEKILPEVLATEKPDLLIADPPRAGIHPKALKAIIRNPPPRIVCVSCNPATLARDLQHLTAEGYTLRAVRPVDMFPHTAHVECVALLERAFLRAFSS